MLTRIKLCVLSLLFVTSMLLSACAPNFSNGSRVGVVTKLSYKGLIFKSWEGEMVMGGMRNKTDEDGNTSMVANIFTFNVDPSVTPQVEAALEKGSRVRLKYRQWAVYPLNIENSHVVIGVEELK